ncbi:MAG: hydantoinase B/oxoprolinase family protein, partial [Alphaproteobacteria bacterium]
KPGVYRNEIVIDGYDTPVKLVAGVEVGTAGIHVDYTGSDNASPFGINVVLNYCKAYSSFGVRCAVAPHVPNNAGSLGPITISAPPGSIVNVERPWPVSARHIIGAFLPDLILGCLAQAIPERVPAEGSASVWGAQLRGGPTIAAQAGYRSNRALNPFDLIFFNSGGSGARPDKDGMSATAFPSGVRALPSEIIETIGPVVIWKKELRPDSGGAGRHRGGLGQIVEVGTIDGQPMAVFAMYDRVKSGARGRAGGGDGTAGRVALASGTGLRAMGLQMIPAHDRLRLELPGGGGFGPAQARDPAKVAQDVGDELVSADQAKAIYRVALAADGTLDVAATDALRANGTNG